MHNTGGNRGFVWESGPPPLQLEHLLQGIEAVAIVVADFVQIREEFIFADVSPPGGFLTLLESFKVAEVTMADFHSTEHLGVLNDLVDGYNLCGDGVHEGFVHLGLKEVLEGVTELRSQGDEGEAAAEGVVHDGQGTVCRVHTADEVNVLRYIEGLVGSVRVGQTHHVLRSALVVLNEHHQFAQYLAEVATVDFIDDEEVRAVVVLGPLAEVIEDAVTHHEAFLRRADALDEILVAVGLVELDHLDAGVVFFTKDGVCNLLGEEGLAYTGRALQNDVLLALQDALDVVEGLRVDEGLFGVFFEGIDGIVLTLRAEQNRLRGTFLDVFQQAVVLGRRQFEQGALVILEHFALLQDVVLEQFGPGDLVAEFLQNLEDEFVFGSLGHFEESLDLLDRSGLVSDDEVAGLDGFEVV